MSSLAHFLSPEVFAALPEEEIQKLGAVIDERIVNSAHIKKEIQDRINAVLPHLPSRAKIPSKP
jgi:hypothetical protein